MHFTKLIRSTPKLINKKERNVKSGKLVSVEVLKTTDIDLVFQKNKEKGKRTVTFNMFGTFCYLSLSPFSCTFCIQTYSNIYSIYV